MKSKRISAGYRENCGGRLRSLSTGLRSKFKSLAESHLYEELRERLFGSTPLLSEEEEEDKKKAA
jgi:hypothetical protein